MFDYAAPPPLRTTLFVAWPSSAKILSSCSFHCFCTQTLGRDAQATWSAPTNRTQRSCGVSPRSTGYPESRASPPWCSRRWIAGLSVRVNAERLVLNSVCSRFRYSIHPYIYRERVSGLLQLYCGLERNNAEAQRPQRDAERLKQSGGGVARNKRSPLRRWSCETGGIVG